MNIPTHEEIENARDNAALDAAAERENENEQFDGPEFQTLGEYETDAERNQ